MESCDHIEVVEDGKDYRYCNVTSPLIIVHGNLFCPAHHLAGETPRP